MADAKADADRGPLEAEQQQARKRPDVERVYRSEQIAVYWEPKLCIHVGECYRGLPGVFQPQDRPWVDVNAAEAKEIAAVVMRCPTGALHFERLDGGPQEPEPGETTIQARPNGPLFVHGRGVGIQWDELDEDISVAGLLRCQAAAGRLPRSRAFAHRPRH